MADEIKMYICNLLEKELDYTMKQKQFTRRNMSLNYIRTSKDNKQRVEFVYYKHPRYSNGAIAHIYPYYNIFFPELDRVVKEIAGNDSLIISMDKISVRQPIQQGITSDMWMLTFENDENIMKEIGDFLNEYTFPFLEDVRDVDGFINTYEYKKDALQLDDCKYLLIISAYIYKGEYQKALDVLEKRFGKPGVRKYYNDTFKYIEKFL